MKRIRLCLPIIALLAVFVPVRPYVMQYTEGPDFDSGTMPLPPAIWVATYKNIDFFKAHMAIDKIIDLQKKSAQLAPYAAETALALAGEEASADTMLFVNELKKFFGKVYVKMSKGIADWARQGPFILTRYPDHKANLDDDAELERVFSEKQPEAREVFLLEKNECQDGAGNSVDCAGSSWNVPMTFLDKQKKFLYGKPYMKKRLRKGQKEEPVMFFLAISLLASEPGENMDVIMGFMPADGAVNFYQNSDGRIKADAYHEDGTLFWQWGYSKNIEDESLKKLPGKTW